MSCVVIWRSRCVVIGFGRGDSGGGLKIILILGSVWRVCFVLVNVMNDVEARRWNDVVKEKYLMFFNY